MMWSKESGYDGGSGEFIIWDCGDRQGWWWDDFDGGNRSKPLELGERLLALM